MTSPNGGASDWTGVTPHFAVGDIVAKRYRVEELLRQDLYGSIYRVRHTRYGQALILKAFHPFHFGGDGDFEALKANFQGVKSLRHAGTVRYLEVGNADDVCYVTMDDVEGKTLRQLLGEYLSSGQVLTVAEARKFALLILEILESIHSTTAHGNITPDNIILPARIKPGLMGETSDIKVSDFALVEVNAAAAGDLQLAPQEEVCYTAPELINYGGEPSPSLDVFAVAAIFYEMLTGRKPVGDFELPSKLRHDVPEELDYFIEATLNKNPSERLNSIAAMRERLEQMPDAPDRTETVQPRRNATYVLYGGLAILAAAAVFVATKPKEVPIDIQLTNQTNELRNSAAERWQEEPKELFQARVKAAPKGMAYVPKGTYVSGYLPIETLQKKGIDGNQAQFKRGQFERPATLVTTEAYYIDIFDAPNKKKTVPSTMIGWAQAKESCEKAGKRLCSADEWERACRGPNSLIYPYGDEFDAGKCAPGKKNDYKIGEYAECTNPYKVRDMAGGTWEWTSTASPEGEYGRIVMGGSDAGDVSGSRCSSRNHENVDDAFKYLSYRCCMDVKGDEAPAEAVKSDK